MKNVLFFLVMTVFASTSFADQQMTFTPEGGKVEFQAKGWPALLKINGKGEGAQGVLTIKDNKASGTLSIAVASFKTGIGMRDDHMKNKYLHVKKFPKAKLVLKDVALPKGMKGKTKFSGTLELHGVKKAVSGKLSLKGTKKGKTKLQASFKIKISDYKIEIPSFKGVTVAEDVAITVKATVIVK